MSALPYARVHVSADNRKAGSAVAVRRDPHRLRRRTGVTTGHHGTLGPGQRTQRMRAAPGGDRIVVCRPVGLLETGSDVYRIPATITVPVCGSVTITDW